MIGFRTDGVHGFYPIVPRASEVAELLQAGARTVQLRVKRVPGVDVSAEVRDALAAGRAVPDAQVVINDHWRLALEHGAAWVHLGQEDLDTADLDAIRAAGVGLGISSHSPGERRRALAADPAYVALGPVFETTLKRMRFAPQGLARVAAWAAACGCPIVAIGGISLAQVPDVLAAGADAVAMVSDVRTDDRQALDPTRIRRWMAAFDTPRSPESP